MSVSRRSAKFFLSDSSRPGKPVNIMMIMKRSACGMDVCHIHPFMCACARCTLVQYCHGMRTIMHMQEYSLMHAAFHHAWNNDLHLSITYPGSLSILQISYKQGNFWNCRLNLDQCLMKEHTCIIFCTTKSDNATKENACV